MTCQPDVYFVPLVPSDTILASARSQVFRANLRLPLLPWNRVSSLKSLISTILNHMLSAQLPYKFVVHVEELLFSDFGRPEAKLDGERLDSREQVVCIAYVHSF